MGKLWAIYLQCMKARLWAACSNSNSLHGHYLSPTIQENIPRTSSLSDSDKGSGAKYISCPLTRANGGTRVWPNNTRTLISPLATNYSQFPWSPQNHSICYISIYINIHYQTHIPVDYSTLLDGCARSPSSHAQELPVTHPNLLNSPQNTQMTYPATFVSKHSWSLMRNTLPSVWMSGRWSRRRYLTLPPQMMW